MKNLNIVCVYMCLWMFVLCLLRVSKKWCIMVFSLAKPVLLPSSPLLMPVMRQKIGIIFLMDLVGTKLMTNIQTRTSGKCVMTYLPTLFKGSICFWHNIKCIRDLLQLHKHHSYLGEFVIYFRTLASLKQAMIAFLRCKYKWQVQLDRILPNPSSMSSNRLDHIGRVQYVQKLPIDPKWHWCLCRIIQTFPTVILCKRVKPLQSRRTKSVHPMDIQSCINKMLWCALFALISVLSTFTL